MCVRIWLAKADVFVFAGRPVNAVGWDCTESVTPLKKYKEFLLSVAIIVIP